MYLVLEAGKGSTLVKADIKAAYRMLPIHPGDQGLLGIQWESEFHSDKALSSGLRSAQNTYVGIKIYMTLHLLLSLKTFSKLWVPLGYQN